MFAKKSKSGKLIRRPYVCDCTNDDKITEDSHKAEVDINNIIKRHGMDLIRKTAVAYRNDMEYGEVTGESFQEAMNKVVKAQDSFNSLPAEVREKFQNNPVNYLDFINDHANIEDMIKMGIAAKREPEQPIEVKVTNVKGETNETNSEHT